MWNTQAVDIALFIYELVRMWKQHSESLRLKVVVRFAETLINQWKLGLIVWQYLVYFISNTHKHKTSKHNRFHFTSRFMEFYSNSSCIIFLLRSVIPVYLEFNISQYPLRPAFKRISIHFSNLFFNYFNLWLFSVTQYTATRRNLSEYTKLVADEILI